MGAVALLLASGLLLSTGCTNIRATTEFEPSLDFSAFESYAWLPDRARSLLNSRALLPGYMAGYPETQLL
jgi:hypothetical protein